MYGVHRAIFMGIFAGSVFLVGITSLIASPQLVSASSEGLPVAEAAAPLPAEQPAEQPVAGEAPASQEPAPAQEEAPQSNGECSLPASYSDSVRQWCDWIQRYAQESGLEANLIAAVITQESGGNAQAYSKSGAVGLMQVMPRDGLAAGFMCINGPCFASRPSSNELYDPEFNIRFGTQMLAGLISRRGSVRDGLMAYGPANVGYYYADKVLAIYESRR